MVRGLTFQSDILEVAMQASVLRNDVILNNIANADTPGFKRSAVFFEEAFQNALQRFDRTGRLDLSRAAPQTRVVDRGFSQRMDGNNVNMELEMVDLFQNAMRYDLMANSVINNYRRIGLVTKSR